MAKDCKQNCKVLDSGSETRKTSVCTTDTPLLWDISPEAPDGETCTQGTYAETLFAEAKLGGMLKSSSKGTFKKGGETSLPEHTHKKGRPKKTITNVTVIPSWREWIEGKRTDLSGKPLKLPTWFEWLEAKGIEHNTPIRHFKALGWLPGIEPRPFVQQAQSSGLGKQGFR